MGHGKSSFNMNNEFNGHGQKTFLKATEYKTYSPLFQEDVCATPNFGQYVQKALGSMPVVTNSNFDSKPLLKALGGVSNANQVQIDKDRVTGRYSLNYHISSPTEFTDDSYLQANSNHGYSSEKVIAPFGWQQIGIIGWKWGQEDGTYLKEDWLKYHQKWYYISDYWMITGWRKIYDNDDFYWFYFKSRIEEDVERLGYMATGWLEIQHNGRMHWFYFHGTGKMAASKWISYKGSWYYLRSDGTMQRSSLREWKGKLYYLKEDGKMAVSETITDASSGTTYYADENGVCSVKDSKLGTLNDIWDSVTINRILTLHPEIRQNVVDFILDAQNQGIKLRITQAYRSIAEQDKLYNQSRNGNTEPWATDAKGGQSYHNYGLAIDVVEIVNGAANWDFDTKKVAAIAMNYGFEWPLPINDAGHFQISYGYSWQQLFQKVQNNQIQDGYIVL